MRTLSEEQVLFFKKNGYIHIKGFFTPEEIDSFREGCKRDRPGDTMCRPEFQRIMFSQKMVDTIKDILGEDIVYPALSLTRTNDYPKPFGSRFFHTDTVDDDEDFSTIYPIVNTGIYLQDHANFSGGLKLIPRSHTRQCITSKTLAGAVKNIVKQMLSGNLSGIWQIFNLHRSVNIPSTPGDLILWYVRTHHSGYNIRLKFFPKVSLPPILENWIPSFLRIQDHPERNVMLSIFAAPSKYLESYIQRQIVKPYRNQHYLHNACLDSKEIVSLAEKRGIAIRNDGYNKLMTHH